MEDERVVLWNRREQEKIEGDSSPLKSELESYLKKNPWCEVYTNQKASMGKKKKKKGKKKGKTTKIMGVAGTRDFPPADLALRNWLFGLWREISNLFGFEEYDAPILERQELYKRKAGEDITKEMYGFKDREDQEICLRPEMTPSLARLVIQGSGKGGALLMPIRWFSIPQCWRFEAATRVRKREHYQWNMDVFGITQVTAEAEILAAIIEFFKRIKLTSEMVKIRVSSRHLIDCVLKEFGVKEEQFAPVCIVVDKLDKKSSEEVKEDLAVLGIAEDTANEILAVLSVKDDFNKVTAIVGEKLANEALGELKELWKLAKAYGMEDWLQFDASVVRGLAYYTGIVFEAFTQRGELRRAICGGGRYNKLLSLYGGTDQPAVGFGFGDVVILEVLRDEGLLPDLEPVVNDVVLAFNEDQRLPAIQVTMKLRSQGRRVDIIMAKKKKLGWAYSYADRVGASRVVLVAPDEWERGEVRIKNLREEEDAENKEVNVKFEDLV